MILIAENKKAKAEVLKHIRKQSHLRKHFCVFHYSASEMKELENILVYNDPFYGQKNVKN